MDRADLRLRIYQHLADTGRAPSVAELARADHVPPHDIEDALVTLATEDHALVLVPGSRSQIWMASPFAGVVTDFEVRETGWAARRARHWYANCIWDALAIPPLVGVDADVVTACPDCGDDLRVSVQDDEVAPTDAVAHFAVPAAAWWDDIGHT